jgi:NAD(P)-dependent dehydrogenase (short-subunit alcohol dehydrogenase family)
MSGKVLVYGGSGGIGSATARRLRAMGYDLHVTGRDLGRLAEVADDLGAGFTVGDVTDPEFFAKVAAEAGDELVGLVYAVGTLHLRSLQRLSEADYLDDYRVNALGAALAVQASLPALKKSADGASIVLFSSLATSQGFPLHASVGMAKGAVNGLTLALAAELAPRIRVNAVAPSVTRTPLTEAVLSNDQTAAAIAAAHPLQRLGQPEDPAALAAFLVSPESGWITGQVIGVDGGRSTLRTKG